MMKSLETRNTNVMDGDETVIFQYGAIETTFSRLKLHISPAGMNQMLNGQIVTSSKDRQTLARFLKLVTGPGASLLISLLLPAVQRIRE